jgi:chemotaxis family two-component system response regulator Rcp1
VSKLIEILLVDDNPDDVELTKESLEKTKIANHVSVVYDGVAAIDFLRRKGKYENAPRPALILLDLNMPKKNGHEVLMEIKNDELLKEIPVVILTTSKADEDIALAYKEHANCYVSKPVNLEQFTKVVAAIDQFWFAVVEYPPDENQV